MLIKKSIHILRSTLIVCFSLMSISFAIAQKKTIDPTLPPLTSVDVGGVKPGTTTLTNEGRGVKLMGYGTMFGMHVNFDQGRFAYTKMKGDFDVIVQVENVASSTQAFAEGGIMVRKDLNPGGLMVANFVTCNKYNGESDQYTSMWRTKEGGTIEPYWDIIEGFYGERTFGNPGFGYTARGWSKTNMPVRPYPYVWLRIIRQGNFYKAYRKFGNAEDWGKWEKMSEITLDLGEEPMVGIALSANHHDPTVGGKIGDPASSSEITILNASGFR